MKQIIEFFDRSYIINLQDRVDRRHQVEKSFIVWVLLFRNQNISFTRPSRPVDKGNFHDIGVRGCYMSHLKVLKWPKWNRLECTYI